MFHMANDSHLFRTCEQLQAEGWTLEGNIFRKGDAVYLPLYEAKMMWQFDHRFGTYEGVRDRNSTHLPTPTPEQYADPKFVAQPWYWVPAEEVETRLADWPHRWLLGFRDITNATNERTAIFSLLPRVGVGNKIPLFVLHRQDAPIVGCLLANVNSLAFDYVARQKLGGTTMNFFIVKQLPVLPPDAYTPADIDFIAPRVLELVYTAWDLEPFAKDTGYDGEPFRWDENRRAVLRAELDAYYARAYGLSRKQLRYILDPADLTPGELKDILDPHEEVSDPLDPAGYQRRCDESDFPGETFRVLKENETRKYGEYRTRRLVLEAWDKMA
jgi:hypothetical protein